MARGGGGEIVKMRKGVGEGEGEGATYEPHFSVPPSLASCQGCYQWRKGRKGRKIQIRVRI